MLSTRGFTATICQCIVLEWWDAVCTDFHTYFDCALVRDSCNNRYRRGAR